MYRFIYRILQMASDSNGFEQGYSGLLFAPADFPDADGFDIRSVNSREFEDLDPTLAMNVQNASIENNNNVRFYIVLGIIGFVVIILFIIGCIYFFRGSTFTGAPIGNFSTNAVTTAATAAAAANAAVATAAVVAKAKGSTSPNPPENKKRAAANTTSPTL